MFRQAQLRVVNSDNQTQVIEYSIRPTAVAQRWAHSVQVANKTSFIREKQRWYNFPGHSGVGYQSVAQKICLEIEEAILKINKVFPNLIQKKIDMAKLQESINAIHVHFADIERNPIYVTDETQEAWNQLNNSLHAFESMERSRESEKISGIPECNIVVTWQEPVFQPLETTDYEHFTVAKKFGTLYINYCQTGRHLYEMFIAKDELAADEHILPLRRLSADTYAWFGSSTGPKSLLRRQEAIHKWFIEHETRLNSLGFYWGDPMLAIGWIPVADIIGDYSELSKQIEFVNELGRFCSVDGLDVTVRGIP